ncbi:hypothetical protein WICPIJ_005509 [Wickerhamomyces pijperi]|uniref:Uncharacterized protein n=1 Tax=Wickerhamomyces pijperi TaxID=599730 RepID=A0A9P8Q3T0_WICPI|nr:hypothetical protein WICPIJ_005509 [Wickerhamomyces pijperi]
MVLDNLCNISFNIDWSKNDNKERKIWKERHAMCLTAQFVAQNKAILPQSCCKLTTLEVENISKEFLTRRSISFGDLAPFLSFKSS